MVSDFPSEKDFLLKLVISNFNAQVGTSYLISDFVIYSIEPKTTSDVGYEITPVQSNNKLKIRAFFNFSDNDEIGAFSLGLLPTPDIGGLNDEVYVAYGLIDRFYMNEDIYKFGFVNNPLDVTSYIVNDDDEIFADDEGRLLIYYG